MNNEKKRVADEIFGDRGMPYSRLKKEFLTADYAIEIKEPLHWVISNTVEGVPIVLDVKIVVGFPFQPPHTTVLSPKVFIIKKFQPGKPLSQLFLTAFNYLKEYKAPALTDIPPQIQEVINLAKATQKPIHLVMGSHPGENPVGRRFYSNPQIFLLDAVEGSGDTRRFFQIDFTKLEQMNWLCSELPGAFETVILDTSTMKFFTPHPDKPEEQVTFLNILACIYKLLANGGVFFIADPGMSFGGVQMMKRGVGPNGEAIWIRNTSPQAGSIMKEMVESVGFQGEYKNTDQLSNPLVNLVHQERTDGYGSRYFLVAKKVTEGGRRKRRGTRRKLNRKKRSMKR